MRTTLPLLALLGLLSLAAASPLPAPALEDGLGKALQNRQTIRNFTGKPLPAQQLSQLLWAAYGVNRPDGKLTVPAALNRHAFSLYVLTQDGASLYLPKEHRLDQVSPKTLLPLADGSGRLGPAAGTAILLVGNAKVFDDLGATPEKAAFYLGVEAGAICQDIYLYCAAQGLGTVCCGSLQADALAKALQLPQGQVPFLTMVVGFPAR